MPWLNMPFPRARATVSAFFDAPLPRLRPHGNSILILLLKAGVVSAQSFVHDREYLTPIGIGTPAQTLMLDLDTGSSDL
jgi:hypothetical protein